MDLHPATEVLEGFSPSTQHVARVAAALGATFDAGHLSRLLNEPVAELLPSLDELVVAGVLVPVRYELAFQHPLVRDALVTTTPPSVLVALRRDAESTAAERAWWSSLTDTERAIAELAAEGLTNGQIARRIGRSTHTVNYHLRRIFRKLRIRSRVEIARFYRLDDPPG